MQKVFSGKNLRILSALAVADFKVKYQNSVLGYFWTLIKPLMLFGVLYVVFSVFMQLPIENYQLYLLLGIIIWNFFAEATLSGLNSFETKQAIVKKVYFPREIIVIASTITSMMTFLLNLVVFFIFVAFSGIAFSWSFLFFIVYILELYFIILGISFILSVLYVKFRDLTHIWEVLLQIGFWMTPIIYSITIIPEQYHRYIFLNPLARLIEYSRELFIKGTMIDMYHNMVLLLITFVIGLFGYFIFRKFQKNIPEKI